MAIFGNLTEFPFLEVISMLRSRSGVLHFSNLRPYESIELRLEAGQLQGLTVDGVPIFDAGMARSYLLEINDKRNGDFEFKKSRDLSTRQPPLRIVVTDALLTISATSDSFPIPDAQLPDPQTRFTLTAVEVARLEDDLKIFWVKAQPLLLRTIGAIRPARRIEETMPTRLPAVTAPNQPVSPTAPKPSLVSRLLGALSFARRAS